jgi:hypothetical protein
MTDEEDYKLTQKIVGQVKQLLTGAPRGIQGVVLAELLAIWLAGHFGDETLRDELIKMHVAQVREFIPIIEPEILASISQIA